MAPARPGLSPAAQKAMAYWGVIELAASSHATTADMWSWIRDAADELGLASPGVTVQGVSQLRGIAGQIVARGEAFGALADSRRVTSKVVSLPPWARTPAERRALPKFAVRFQHTYTDQGNLVTEWRTSVFGGKPNHTAGQLRALVELDAANMARKYGKEHVSTDNLQVMVV